MRGLYLTFFVFILICCAVPTIGEQPPREEDSAAISEVCGLDASAQRAFANLAIAKIRSSGFAGSISYVPEKFELAVEYSKDETIKAFLGNAQHDFCHTEGKDARDAILSNYAGIWTAARPPTEHAMPEDLLPAVRGRDYIEFTRLEQYIDEGASDPIVIVESLGSDMVVVIGIDRDSTLGLLNHDGLDNLGYTNNKALEVAVANLRKRTKPNWIEVIPHVYMSGWRDFHDPSRLLLVEQFRNLSIDGDPVAIAIDPNTLLVTGSGNFEELSKFSRLARVAFEDTSRAISGQALILSGDKWVDFVPSDPALADFISLRRERQNISYDNQTPLLQKLYDNRGEDVYVADFDLFRPDERSPWLSFTTWASGIVSLLPKADMIGFVENESADPILVTWDKATPIIGHLMAETNDYPPRYRVDHFPSATEIEKLRALAE